jgi:hypothetical protein
VDPLVRGVEPAGVPDHADQAGLLLDLVDLLGVRPAVRDRDLDLDMLARAHRGDGLLRVQLGRGAQDDRVDIVAGEGRTQVGRGVVGAVLLRGLLGLLLPAADHRRDGHAVDDGQGVEVLDAERAGSGDCDPHGLVLFLGGWVGRPQHEVPDRGVGSGDVVEAVQLLH